MKVIHGIYKGRNITCPQCVRPVQAAIRKACFDVLGEEIKGKRVLDLFAGTGAMAIEALSGLAKEAVFVDSNPACARNIENMLAAFKIEDKAQVYFKDAFEALKDFSAKGKKFDIIFIDPPYYRGIIKKTLQALSVYDILAPLGLLVCLGYSKDQMDLDNEKFSLIFERKYGQTVLLIYQAPPLRIE